MKTRHTILVVTVMIGFISAPRALAQGTPPGTNPPALSSIERSATGQPPITERPTVIPPAATTDTGPARPELPGQTAPSSELRDRVKDFQTARETFLKQQQDLLAQLKLASKEEREALRQQLREKLDALREQLQDIREQAREIKNNVPSISDVVDSGAGEGRGR